MVDISVIAGAVSALSGAAEIARGLVGVRDHAVMQTKTIELQGLIVSALGNAAVAQSEQIGLLQEIQSLKAIIAEHEKWDAIERMYFLKDFGSSTLAYELRPGNSEPAHLACPNCFQNKKRSILQFAHKTYGRSYFDCHSCGKTIVLGTYEASTRTMSLGSGGF